MNQLKLAVSGAQILFVAFGAMVLVPLLTKLNPSLALLGAGIGTLLFQIVTKRKVPIFLGSSFAFIAPIIYSIGEWGLPSTMFGLFAAGFMYFVFAALIRLCGCADFVGLYVCRYGGCIGFRQPYDETGSDFNRRGCRLYFGFGHGLGRYHHHRGCAVV